MNKKYIGVLAILGASIMWAIEPIFAKLSYVTTDFIQTSATRAIFAALTALLYIILSKNVSLKITKKQIPKVLYIAIAGTIFADFMYLYALTQIPVINAVIIGHMQPIFIILIAFIFLKEDKLTYFDYLGIVLLMISGVLVTTKTLENLLVFNIGTIGDLLVLSATIAWATCAIVMRKYLHGMNAGILTFYRFFIAAILFLIYLIMTTNLIINNYYQIVIGIIVGLGTILYYEGLKRLKAAQVSGLELSTPFFAAILGFIVLSEFVTIMQIIGMVILFFGILFISKKEKKEI